MNNIGMENPGKLGERPATDAYVGPA